ncbi:hypothetical protein AS589_03265 [Empedobacter brevis]|uniref:site-specific DNA-methyltransferase n=1 Tax=Empedobacter brevis TaxID=247 RepID=UPI00132038CE|nr:site-specific DNA-methyltransferase [Empedobacter brevis]QHC83879.1 hypothetical protein AS589_03265 [Empedobacter brevis]
MNKQDLIKRIKDLIDISNDEKAYLIELVNTKKKYGLVWEDKPEDVEEQLRSMLPVFKEVTERAIVAENPEAPNHILIEGDNLHALTALSYTHEGKVDVIYIDPPYNTKNKDFKYNDTFVDKEDSFRHSKWLSFMDKRLRLAKKLLSEKGVIFISIDDNENAQLKLLCDDVFGENNFIRDIIWQSRKSVSNDAFISLNHNYTLFYSKNFDNLNKENFKLPINTSKFENLDNDPRGAWSADPFDAPGIRPNLTYPIINPNNGKEYLPAKGRCWRVAEVDYIKFLNDNRIVFGKNGLSKPQLKRFLNEAEGKGATATSLWNDIETTTNGTQQLESILGDKLFTNPKPLGLLLNILKLTTTKNKNSIILDFFAGSGTTLHATMTLNAEDGGNRQCILVTNNENNIAEEVTYERNKRVIQGHTNAKGEHVEGLSNNTLRYYQADFVPSERTEINRRLLTARSTELLCIKENCFIDNTKEFSINEKQAKLFTNGLGKYMVVVYHTRNQDEVIEQLSGIIADLDTTEKVKVYAFSPEKEIIEDDFYKVADKITAVPLPDSIYNAYRATFRTLKLDKKEAVSSTTNQEA